VRTVAQSHYRANLRRERMIDELAELIGGGRAWDNGGAVPSSLAEQCRPACRAAARQVAGARSGAGHPELKTVARRLIPT
jgi:hypothetical protein